MEKRKGKKLIGFGVFFLILAIAFGAMSIFFGALDKDNWLDASKKLRVKNGLHETPVHIVKEIDSHNLDKFEAKISGGNLNISYQDVDKISVEYYENYLDEIVVNTSDHTLVIDRDFDLGSLISCTNAKINFSLGFDWFLYREFLDINIILPSKLSFSESNIDISGGKTNINSVSLGDVKMKISGGVANLDSLSLRNLEVKISGGTANVNNSYCDDLNVKLSGGIFKFNGGNTGDYVNLSVSGGSIEFNQFPCPSNELAFDLSLSGGYLKLNGSKISEGRSGSFSPTTLIKAKISGGRININTNC